MTGKVVTKNNQLKDYFKNSTQNDIHNNALEYLFVFSSC